MQQAIISRRKKQCWGKCRQACKIKFEVAEPAEDDCVQLLTAAAAPEVGAVAEGRPAGLSEDANP